MSHCSNTVQNLSQAKLNTRRSQGHWFHPFLGIRGRAISTSDIWLPKAKGPHSRNNGDAEKLQQYVSFHKLFIPILKSYFEWRSDVFQCGKIKGKFENRQKLTDDTDFLETVKCATFEFESVTQQTFTNPSQKCSAQEEKFVQVEIDKLKRKRVVETHWLYRKDVCGIFAASIC